MTDRLCPVCRDETVAMQVPVAVRRAGRVVLELRVRAASCPTCGHLDVDDATQERVLAELERHSRPGDDIVFSA